ncbi:MAG: LLM class flavin-dependent oxidoreductase [Chloroflexi bacterium]|nr:LLM class flavin-dependent oxidoreductase [Chloroflexota bacterium]
MAAPAHALALGGPVPHRARATAPGPAAAPRLRARLRTAVWPSPRIGTPCGCPPIRPGHPGPLQSGLARSIWPSLISSCAASAQPRGSTTRSSADRWIRAKRLGRFAALLNPSSSEEASRTVRRLSAFTGSACQARIVVEESKLRFGIRLPSLQGVAEFAERVESLGFDYLFCGEHVFFHRPTMNAFIALSAAAATTTKIELLSAITLLPLYPAALAAKMASCLDILSSGRFNLGVGVGGEYPAEFEACGVSVRSRGRRTDESLEILRRLFTGEEVNYRGRFQSISAARIDPPPVRHPSLPIWIAGRREAAIRRAARFGDFWMPYLYTPEQVARSLAEIAEHRDAATQAPIRCGLFVFITAYQDGTKAERVAAERVGRQYRQDFTRLVSRYLIAGTPAQCRSRLREYVDAGVDVSLLVVTAPTDEYDGMVALIAEEVMPEFRQ